MAWTDRVHDAVIETQAGDRFVFEFRDLEAKRDDNTNVFNFLIEKIMFRKPLRVQKYFRIHCIFQVQNATQWLMLLSLLLQTTDLLYTLTH